MLEKGVIQLVVNEIEFLRGLRQMVEQKDWAGAMDTLEREIANLAYFVSSPPQSKMDV